jgi:hypothetical protein
MYLVFLVPLTVEFDREMEQDIPGTGTVQYCIYGTGR